MLCTVINDGMIESLQELRFNVGTRLQRHRVSIDPHETPEVRGGEEARVSEALRAAGAERGLAFSYRRSKARSRNSTNEAGFRFTPLIRHYMSMPIQAALSSSRPEGRISRYFFGVNFDPNELRSAIIAASKGQNGSVIKQLILLCYHYNPITGKYGALVLTVLRVLGIGTVLRLAAGSPGFAGGHSTGPHRGGGWLAMNDFHLFPVEASSGAAQVDWLFFGLVLMSLFFLCGRLPADHLFLHSLPTGFLGRPL